jgi:hypothetical protein
LTSLEKEKTLAENGGLDVELEPEGVFGIWNAGPCKLNRDAEEPFIDWLPYWWGIGCGMLRGGGRVAESLL